MWQEKNETKYDLSLIQGSCIIYALGGRETVQTMEEVVGGLNKNTC